MDNTFESTSPIDSLDAAAPRPPQGITISYMATGNDAADFLKLGETKYPRVDPACLGEAPYLAVPIQGQPGKYRVRQHNADVAADILTREVFRASQEGREALRLATDEEVKGFHAEAAERARQMQVDKERLAQAALERHLAEAGHQTELAGRVREMYTRKD